MTEKKRAAPEANRGAAQQDQRATSIAEPAVRGKQAPIDPLAAVPDPFPDFDEAVQAFIEADAAGTTTDEHLVAVWWAIAPIRSKLPDELGYRATKVMEARMSERALSGCRRAIDELVSTRIAQAITDGLPVLEDGALVALVETDLAIARAKA
jgi:hypothetical protein